MGHSPALWNVILKDAVQRSHERELASRIGKVDGGGTGRVCLDVPRRVITFEATPEEGKRAIDNGVCNAVWTMADANAAGYNVPNDLCGLCGQHPDTLHNRLWVCQHPKVMEARERIVDHKFIRKATAAGEESLLYNRGVLDQTAW